MPASGSVTKEQLERDVMRAREAAKVAMEREQTLLGTLRLYFPNSALLKEAGRGDTAPAFDALSIADACETVLRDLGNEWQFLADLDLELQQRGMIRNKGSIEIMLKGDPGRFEIEKRGKKNAFRLKSAVYDVKDTGTTKK